MTEQKNNLITVGIPFYSKTNPRYFVESVDSILKQTFQPLKIHLIQDGPISDDLTRIIKKYKNNYRSLFEIIVLDKKGLPYALNQSIYQTTTKYYARMDSDDIAFKTRLEEQVSYLEKNIDIDILGSWAKEFDQSINEEKYFINRKPIEKSRIVEYFHYMNPLIHPTVVFRMSVFDKIGFYNEKFYNAQDLELWARALKYRVGISNIQKPLLYFRIEGRQKKRSSYSAIKRQIIARYSYNTISIKLNILKIVAIIFRLLPEKFRLWGYKHIR